MMFAPHILQKKVVSPIERDEFGRIISGNDEVWEDVCPCRCDDNTTQEFASENGSVYRPNYHVVCEANNVKAGDFVRCLDNGIVRGEGEVFMAKSSNWFKYTELWL